VSLPPTLGRGLIFLDHKQRKSPRCEGSYLVRGSPLTSGGTLRGLLCDSVGLTDIYDRCAVVIRAKNRHDDGIFGLKVGAV